MMGKIIGIALVGLTQIDIWIVLGFMILSMAKGMIGNPSTAQQAQSLMAQSDATAQQMARLSLLLLPVVPMPLIQV
jgi:ABC-2 type transport system permease protein